MKKFPLPPDHPLAAGYIRVSKLEEGMTDADIEKVAEDRRREIRMEAERRGLPMIGFYEDLDKSGTNMTRRLSFLQLLQDAKAGKVTHILTRAWSRLFRDVYDMLGTERDLEPLGVAIVSIGEPYLEQRNADTAMIKVVLGAVNEHQAHKTGEAIYKHRRDMAQAGLYCGGKIPLGLDWDGQKRTFVANDRAGDVVRIFELFAQLKSAHAVAHRLNALGLPAKEGSQWRHRKVLDILRQPLYRGFQTYDHELYPCEVDPLVPPALLETVESILGTWRFTTYQKPATGKRYTFSGFLRCCRCGHGLRMTRKDPIAVSKRSYYICGGRKEEGTCDLPLLREDRLLALVEGGILALLDQEQTRLERWQHQAPSPTPSVPSPPSLDDEIRRLRDRRRRLLALMAEMEPGSSVYEDAQAVLGELGSEIRDLERGPKPEEEDRPPIASQEVLSLYRTAWQQFSRLPVDDQHAMMLHLHLRLETDGTTLTLYSRLGTKAIPLP